jgi:hypothetical protein
VQVMQDMTRLYIEPEKIFFFFFVPGLKSDVEKFIRECDT